jgi:hypothetical protein
MRAVITGSDLINVLSVRFDDSQISVVDIGAQRETEVEIFLAISPRAIAGPHSFIVETQTGVAESPPRVVFTVLEEVTPTFEPTVRPTIGPTIRPTIIPTILPTIRPTIVPTILPTIRPTILPTVGPTIRPTIVPTILPTIRPTIVPTIRPTIAPTTLPTIRPTIVPTIRPTIGLPTVRPGPTFGPTFIPASESGAALPAEFNADDFPGRTVTEVKGIGPATAGRLEKENITNLAHLASMTPGKLAEILEISEVRAMEFIDEARRLLTEEE